MSNWMMLTLVGRDQPGIVARVSQALVQIGANLGEASMMRLGGEFSIMLRAQYTEGTQAMFDHLAPVADELGLHLHVDACEGSAAEHPVPNVRISVAGADRPGIVSEVTDALAKVGFNILELESDSAGTEEAPIYLMHIEGVAEQGEETVQTVLEPLKAKGIDVSAQGIELLLG